MELVKIEGFDKYFISKSGEVFSKHGKNEMALKKHINKGGYEFVVLSKQNKSHTRLVHRLVANAFIKNPDKKRCINHLNEIKTDNNVENLKWCNHTENNNYGNRTKKAIDSISKPVLQKSMSGTPVKVWKSISEAIKFGGFNSHITCVCNGKRKQSNGYFWEFI